MKPKKGLIEFFSDLEYPGRYSITNFFISKDVYLHSSKYCINERHDFDGHPAVFYTNIFIEEDDLDEGDTHE